MAAVETGIQALIGIVLGWLVSVLIAPVFTHVKFQDRPVAFEEIILPWWGYLAVAAVLFLLALAAALAGMRRVRVSPLGVAKRQMPAAFRWWRLIAFLLIVTVGGALLKGKSDAPEISVAVVLFAVVMSINLVAPYLLQIGARLLALLPGTAHLVACQRVNANARRAWRQSAAIGFFGFLAGFLLGAPMGTDALTTALKEEQETGIMFRDVSTGVILTLLFGFALTSMSIFLGQVSSAFEDKELIRSLDLMGVPRRFQFSTNARAVMGPIVALSLFGFLFGGSIAALMFFSALEGEDIDLAGRFLMSFGFLALGWAVTFLAIALVEPLRSQVLRSGRRRE